MPGYFSFGGVNERAENFDLGVGAETYGVAHRLHEVFAAIRVDRMVPGMSRDDQALSFNGFCEPASNGKHNPVSEWDDGLLHGLLLIMTVGNRPAGFEEIGFEELANKFKPDDVVRDTEVLGVRSGERDFLVIMLGAVVEAEGPNYLVGAVRLIKG